MDRHRRLVLPVAGTREIRVGSLGQRYRRLRPRAHVAAALAEGKMLYRDVWYLYGPGAPYLNSLLFRTFGIHLNVMYFAGSLAGLATTLTLFRCALTLPANGGVRDWLYSVDRIFRGGNL